MVVCTRPKPRKPVRVVQIRIKDITGMDGNSSFRLQDIHHILMAFIIFYSVAVFDDNSHESFISQLLLEEPFDEAQCDKMALEIAATDAETPLDAVPRLQGKWVSQE